MRTENIFGGFRGQGGRGKGSISWGYDWISTSLLWLSGAGVRGKGSISLGYDFCSMSLFFVKLGERKIDENWEYFLEYFQDTLRFFDEKTVNVRWIGESVWKHVLARVVLSRGKRGFFWRKTKWILSWYVSFLRRENCERDGLASLSENTF